MPKTLEQRTCSHPIEVRTASDGSVNLRGYASVFNAPAYDEVVKPSAFNRSLARKDDIRLLVNHAGVPIARTKSGTLTLSVDDTGLLAEANGLDPSNPTVQELTSAMRRGDIDQMSFAFEAVDAPTVDGVRELREVKLGDVSIVTYPWYDTTSVELNSLDRALISLRSRQPLDPDERTAVMEALKPPKTGLSLAQRTREIARLRGIPNGAASFDEVEAVILDAICDRIEDMSGIGSDDLDIYIADCGPDWVVYAAGSDYMLVEWSLDAAGAVVLGDATEVQRVTTWTPAIEADDEPGNEAKSMTAAEARALLGLTLTA